MKYGECLHISDITDISEKGCCGDKNKYGRLCYLLMIKDVKEIHCENCESFTSKEPIFTLTDPFEK